MNPEITLRIDTSGHTVRAVITVVNATREDAYLEKAKLAADGDLEVNIFRITTNGRKVRYIGKSAKLRDPTREDFLKLAPGQQYENAIDITGAYDFLPGRHTYTAMYSALHGYPQGGAAFWELRSNEIMFAIER